MRAPLAFVLLVLTATALAGHTKDEWASRTIYFLLTDRFAKTDGSTNACSDWRTFCGGTFDGLTKKLDYIHGMGFDAIWITPVVKNTANGYHGYWAKDFNTIADEYGGADALHRLVKAAHARDMWVMVDIVANHVGPVGNDFSQISPFNRAEHYHPNCAVQEYNCFTDEVYHCRLADLPDLNQDNQWVRDQLKGSLSKLVSNFSFDGVRADTVMYIKPDFWKELQQKLGVYMVGEVFSTFDCNVNYVRGGIDATLDYPDYYNARNAFGGQQSLRQLLGIVNNWKSFPNNGAYEGVFLDNHDNPRFLNSYGGKVSQYKNALVWLMFAGGIPIVYYGTEQEFSGGNDPANREPLWTSHYNVNADMYMFLNRTIHARKASKPWAGEHIQRYYADSFYCFTRNGALVGLTNQNNDYSQYVQNLPYPHGTRLCDVVGKGGCLTVDNSGGATVALREGLPSVYLKA
eukprot:TRINITY_DN2796_c0_g1_i1.p1 TRINITY_DN2796_c0_g1~~TRINITY_DN2796_c0_g1_i1.p1  ORF type:complete len:460 (-),score=90.44 TRINITY_DN2796_c0_g1_i1:63-1442(-)